MSKAVICDECGRILKSSDALHCFEAITKEGRNIYGADICKKCFPLFDTRFDVKGWRLSYKKEAHENQIKSKGAEDEVSAQ